MSARLPLSIRCARLAALLIASAAICACGILPKAQTITLYAPQPQVAIDPAWPKVAWQLQIARPYADTAHDSARILVRPQAGELQVYKGAAWSQPAPDLIHDLLLRTFADSGRVAGVARRGEGVRADYELLLDLRRFESDYDGGATPRVRIELGARLVHRDDNRIVGARVFEANVLAEGTAIAQIDRAFERGLGDVTTQIVSWSLREGR